MTGHLTGDEVGHSLPLRSRGPQFAVTFVSKRYQINEDCQLFLDLERAGRPKVGEKLITEAHDEEPDVPSHLRSCHKKAPGDEEEGGIKEVVNISEPF